MKNLKIILLTIVLSGTFVSANAQRVAAVYPGHGTVVTTIHKPSIVIHKGVNFHFSNGVWYTARGRKYVVCAPPVGITVRRLPRGRKAVVYNGRKLYRYKGVWYKKNGRGYVIVNV